MSSTTREEVLRHLTAVADLQPPVQKTGKAPYPTDMTHELYRALTRSPHDIGGEQLTQEALHLAAMGGAGNVFGIRGVVTCADITDQDAPVHDGGNQ